MTPLSPFDRDEYRAAHPQPQDRTRTCIVRVLVAGMGFFALWGGLLWWGAR